MDFKKFGNVVLILGIVVLLYGGFQWVSNQPNPQDVPAFVGGDRMSVEWRKSLRDDAIKILIAGGIVAFVGLGISYSANKKE
ncbi:MAG: hypothetical protein AABN34_06905 [Acidobacteriota bacterium]